MIVGEGPGQKEDELGKPFVGDAGELLNKMLKAINLDREKVYITNVVNYRPPNNRKPLANEVKECMPWLNEQIELIKPKIIVLAGSTAVQSYLNIDEPISKLRGTLNKIGLAFPETPVFEGQSGSFDLPLSLFGGRFGKDENTPYDEFVNDDGISNQVEGGLSLKIEYEMMPKNQSCKVYAKIV